MTRTVMQWFLQRDDPDVANYDFAGTRQLRETWWFRTGIVAAVLVIAGFFLAAIL